MGGEKKAYGTYGEGGTGKGKIIWNVNKEYKKKSNFSTGKCISDPSSKKFL